MGMEHRWGRRQSTDVTVEFLARSGKVGNGRVLNISSTGAYLQTAVSLPLNSLVYLEPTAPMPIVGNIRRIAASVVRQDARGVGLEWCESVIRMAAPSTENHCKVESAYAPARATRRARDDRLGARVLCAKTLASTCPARRPGRESVSRRCAGLPPRSGIRDLRSDRPRDRREP
jgi:hypothetical protein